jgi:integrase
VASIYKRGRTWWISYYVAGRHRCESLKTDSQKVAEAFRKKYEYELVTKSLKIQDKVDLEELVKEYLKDVEARCSDKTLETTEIFFKWFQEKTRFTYLNQLSPATVQDYFRQLQLAGRAPATVNRYREILHAFFNYAIRAGTWVLENPITKVPRMRCPDPVIRFLTLKEIDVQLEKLQKYRCTHAMVATLIYAGLRREEMTWLTMKDVDLDKATLYVVSKNDGKEGWCSKTKRNRAVPISSDLLPILTRFLLWRRRKYAKCSWFFPSPNGQRWDPDNFSNDLRVINRDTKLDWSCQHYRHTFGSQLAQKGVSLFKISELMGNSPEIARRHYAALVPDRMREDVEFGPTFSANVGKRQEIRVRNTR